MKRDEDIENNNNDTPSTNEKPNRKKNGKALFTIINTIIIVFGGYTLFSNLTYIKKITSQVDFDAKVKLDFLGEDGTVMNRRDGWDRNVKGIQNDTMVSGKKEVEKEDTSDPIQQNDKPEQKLLKEATDPLNATNDKDEESWSSETAVFQNMLKRAQTNLESCGEVTKWKTWNETFIGKFTDMPYLPKFGIINTLSEYLSLKRNSSYYPYTCSLPPPKSCNATGYSVILLTHDTSDKKRLQTMINGINSLKKRPLTKEIILVWNGEDLQEERLLKWDKDPRHPLRIFYHNLGNDLFNRWHPDINPKMDAVLYYDDDGPFFDEVATNAGFELWKRNSDVPVAAYYRNFRFKSNYQQNMQKAMQTQMNAAVEQIEQQSPNGYPSFIPFCSTTKRDLEYNFFTFPSFGSHMFLPSGVILHRNFLCWLWHPVFREVRKYLRHHPTHCDDVTVSTLTNQVTGKSFRVYPRRVNKAKPATRRRLLWEKKNWPDLRTEAINSLTGYFGSLSYGSVGWCVGTKYLNRKDRRQKWLDQSCSKEFPESDEVPWSNEGGLGFDQC